MTTTNPDSRFSIATVPPLYWVAIVLSLVTGAIHLYLGVSFITNPLGWSFLFAGIVFVVAPLAVFTDTRRRAVLLLGIPFTAGQIFIWYLITDSYGMLDLVDKVAQTVLILVLVALLYRDR